ncbi:hypothetical protein GGS24DRAFT_493099 [Hypoxylon argillaceum]|nr:hypothetical protein GGS24DRAFT_493099 [Hypoxylon argillaceum]
MGLGPSGQELEWQYDHRDETRVSGLIAACISTAVASAVVIALRLVSRRLLHGRLHLDASDWLLFIAWVFFVAVDVALAVGTKYGFGRHMAVVNDFHKVQILAVVSEATYVSAIAFIKFSALALYCKSFPMRKLQYCVWGFIIFVVGWAMSGAVVAIFQCNSIDNVWQPEAQELCIDFGLRNLISGIINSVTNILIVAIPIPLVWNLQITKQNKWLVLVPFAVGGSVCVIGIIRLPYSISIGTTDATWDVVPSTIVSVVEIAVGMLAVSIPTYHPLYEYVTGGKKCIKSKNTRVCKYKEALHIGLYGEGMRNDVNITSPGIHMGSDHTGINVTNHIELVRHTNKSGNWVRVMDEDEEELHKPTDKVQAKGS